MKTTTLALVLVALVACSHDKAKVANTTPTPTKDQPPAKKEALASQVTEDQKVSPTLAISGDLVAMCGIKAAAQANAKFDYDKDELTTEDRNVLDQLAAAAREELAGYRFKQAQLGELDAWRATALAARRDR